MAGSKANIVLFEMTKGKSPPSMKLKGLEDSIQRSGLVPGILEHQVVDRSCHCRSVDRRESRNFFRTKIGTKDPILVDLDFTTP
jgi:hypothetical protein